MVVVLVLVVVVVVGGGGGGVILGEVKARPKDIISFSLDYISKSKVQTSNPSSSPISLDTPARPADWLIIIHTYLGSITPNKSPKQPGDPFFMAQVHLALLLSSLSLREPPHVMQEARCGIGRKVLVFCKGH